MLFVFADCSKKPGSDPVPVPATNDVEMWLTKADQSVLLQKQSQVLSFGSTANIYPNIDVDSAVTASDVDRFSVIPLQVAVLT